MTRDVETPRNDIGQDNDAKPMTRIALTHLSTAQYQSETVAGQKGKRKA